jgi:beta-xylosidase
MVKSILTIICGTLITFPGFCQQVMEKDAQNNRNPIIADKYSTDPSAIVYHDTVFLYTGHDEAAAGEQKYVMHDWLSFYSTDMVRWTELKPTLRATDFKWAADNAWASQVIERDGKFYWYVAVKHKTIPGSSIGVAVSDRPDGPFRDARGSALITNDMTTTIQSDMDDIDPTILIDDDGQAYIFWGHGLCYYAKLKKNMIELDGPIHIVPLPHFTEGSYIHKRNGWYYLSYAYGYPEKIGYAMSRNINGPWEFKGILNEIAGNCITNSPAILEFKGKSYFIYHNGALPGGGSYRRSVCIDYLSYNPDNTIQRVVMTSEGVSPAE